MSSTNYRAYKVNVITSSVALGKNSAYPSAWGIMKGESFPTGSINLEGGGSVSFTSLDNHQIFPCYPLSITIVTGSILLLQ